MLTDQEQKELLEHNEIMQRQFRKHAQRNCDLLNRLHHDDTYKRARTFIEQNRSLSREVIGNEKMNAALFLMAQFNGLQDSFCCDVLHSDAVMNNHLNRMAENLAILEN
jgi:hypothetical protein